MIDITVDNSVVELGKSVSGQISWQSNKSSQKPLTVKVIWHVEGRGNKKKQTVAMSELGKLSSGNVIPFCLDLPNTAPVSFDGKLFRVIWEVLVEIPGGLLGGTTQTTPIQVVPKRSSP